MIDVVKKEIIHSGKLKKYMLGVIISTFVKQPGCLLYSLIFIRKRIPIVLIIDLVKTRNKN